MLVPHHLRPPPPPPISGKGCTRDYPLSRVLISIGNYTNKQKTNFPGFVEKSSQDYGLKIPPFPRKWEYACGPLMHSSEGGGGNGKPHKIIFENLSETWLSHGSYGVFVAVTGSIRPAFFLLKIALRGSYGIYLLLSKIMEWIFTLFVTDVTPWGVTSVITSFGVNIEWTGRDSTRWVVNFHSTGFRIEWNSLDFFTP